MSLTFLHPGLLWTLLAIAVPVLIHRLLRPRPRRVRFPAAALLSAALAAGRRAQRLSDWRLLVTRCALIGLLGALLAGPRCSAPQADGAESAGVQTAVVVLDESWSTAAARADQSPEWERLRAGTVAYAEQAARRWPVGAELGLVSTLRSREPIWPTPELPWLADRVRRLEPPAANAATLTAALTAAVRMLERGRPGEREIFVASDMAAHAWRDVPAGLLAKVDGVHVRLLARPAQAITNLTLVDVRATRPVYAAGLPIRLEVTLRAAGVPAAVRAIVHEGERVVAQAGPWSLAAGETSEQAVVVPPLPAGVHGLEMRISPDDRLGFDQGRFVALACGPKPVAWLVDEHGAGAAAQDDVSTLLLRTLLSPDTLAAEQQPLRFRHLAVDELTERVDRADSGAGPGRGSPEGEAPQLIVMTPVGSVSDAARGVLERSVQGGATLLLVPGSADGGARDWPALRRRVSSAVPQVESSADGAGLVVERGGAAAGELAALEEMGRAVVSRRIRAEPESGATVAARYRDGAPAILQVRLGRGRIVLLTTSPDPAWSELGIRAGGLLAWLHELAQPDSGATAMVANVEVGAECPLIAPATLGDAAEIKVTRGAGSPSESLRVKLVEGRPSDGWPTAEPGLYRVLLGAAEAVYAVNWPAAEGDLRPLEESELLSRLGVERVTWMTGPDSAGGERGAGFWPATWRFEIVLALAVLAVLAVEQLLAAGRRGSPG